MPIAVFLQDIQVLIESMVFLCQIHLAPIRVLVGVLVLEIVLEGSSLILLGGLITRLAS